MAQATIHTTAEALVILSKSSSRLPFVNCAVSLPPIAAEKPAFFESCIMTEITNMTALIAAMTVKTVSTNILQSRTACSGRPELIQHVRPHKLPHRRHDRLGRGDMAAFIPDQLLGLTSGLMKHLRVLARNYLVLGSVDE